MKKLIAISVMCALVAGAAFAETSVGGQVFVGATLLQGDNIKDSQIQTAAISDDQYNTAVKVTFSEGPAGGRIRILGNNVNGSDAFDEWFGWWRPIPQLRIQFGRNQDGDFGNAQISGWGFTGENKNNGGNGGAMAEYSGDNWSGGRDFARSIGWYPGTGGTPNLQFTINAVDNLTVNLWIPFSATQNSLLTFGKFEANVQYRLTDIGNVTLSFQSNTGWVERDKVLDGDRTTDPQTPLIDGKPDPDYKHKADPASWHGAEDLTGTPKIWASFYLTAIDNIGVDLGLAYKFPLSYEYKMRAKDGLPEYTYKHNENFPFEIGLGFRYGQGDFAFKLRTSIALGGSTESTTAPYLKDGVDGEGYPVKNLVAAVDETVEDTLKISVNILPSYKLGANTFFFYAGIGIQSLKGGKDQSGGIYASSGSDTVINWFINPYVFIPAGSLRFKVGFQIWSDGVGYPYYEKEELKYDNPLIKWAVPIAFYTYF